MRTYNNCVGILYSVEEEKNILVYDLNMAYSVSCLIAPYMNLEGNNDLLEKIFEHVRYLGLKLDNWTSDEACNSFFYEVVNYFIEMLVEELEKNINFNSSEKEIQELANEAFRLAFEIEKSILIYDLTYSMCEIKTENEEIKKKVIEILNNKMNLNFND